MKFSAVESVRIPARKVRDYLLSPSHPIGRYKATFFQSLGYDQGRWETLAADLQGLLTREAKQTEITDHGIKYEIRGSIVGPNGRSAEIVTAWIILTGEEAPRFVTAYPED